MNKETNEILVHACTQYKRLTATPTGTIYFSFIKLPIFLDDLPEVDITVYVDNTRKSAITDGVSENYTGIPASSLMPGDMDVELF